MTEIITVNGSFTVQHNNLMCGEYANDFFWCEILFKNIYLFFTMKSYGALEAVTCDGVIIQN